MQAALGFRHHTGWAVVVTIAADRGAPAVLDRRRLELSTPDVPVQAYHAASGLPLDRATALVGRAHEVARATTAGGVGELVAELSARGHEVAAVGVLVGHAAIPPELAKILRSHPLLHAAEGDMFREVIADAAEQHGLRVVEVPARGLMVLAQRSLGIDEAELRATLNELGHTVGRPWRRDEKDAALAGWLALKPSSDEDAPGAARA
jgi:hypothetical protein